MDNDRLNQLKDALTHTRSFTRISQIAFLGVLDHDLPKLIPRYQAFSRADHTIGVYGLACRVIARLGLDDDLALSLGASALLHDLAHPPFSHSVEYAFSKAEREVDHHSALIHLLTKPNARSYDLFRVMREFKIDIDLVIRILSGADDLSFFFDAPINIDTLDGITRSFWTISSFRNYDYHRICDYIADIYDGKKIQRLDMISEMDAFWAAKSTFYGQFLSGRVAAIEKDFQKEVRRRLHHLDYSIFDLTDAEFEQRFPEIVRKNRGAVPNDGSVATQVFFVDPAFSVIDKESIFKRYRRERRDNIKAKYASAV